MQVLNLTDGTAERIKSSSEIVIADEGKLSDRDLIALMLTIKGYRDCFRLNKQFNYHMVDVENMVLINELPGYKKCKSNYVSSIKIELKIPTFFKDLEIIFEDVKPLRVNLKVKTLIPGNLKSECKDEKFKTVGDVWMKTQNDEILTAKITSSQPIKLPIRIKFQYKGVSLPIPFPEKYEIESKNGFWIFTKLHDTMRWKGEIIQFEKADQHQVENLYD